MLSVHRYRATWAATAVPMSIGVERHSERIAKPFAPSDVFSLDKVGMSKSRLRSSKTNLAYLLDGEKAADVFELLFELIKIGYTPSHNLYAVGIGQKVIDSGLD